MSHKKTVLFVDDEEINLFLFRSMFKKNWDIITAGSGKDALDQLRENPMIDIVFSDMRMPEMSGLEFANLAKQVHPTIPVSIISGYLELPEIQDALKKRLISGFFQKPYSEEDIINHVQEVTKQSM